MVKSKSQVNKIVNAALSILSADIQIDAAVIFGSYVNGRPHEYSDIDLAVFSRTVDRWSFDRKVKLACKLKKVEPMVELHLYSFRALKEARPTNFHGHIIETGKKVA